MVKRQHIKAGVGLRLLAVAALVLTIVSTQARAQDADGDGLTDAQEAAGAITVCGVSYTVSQNAPDLFVRYLSTNLITDTIKTAVANLIAKPTAEGGLGTTVHVIPANCTNLNRCLIGAALPCPQWVDVTESNLVPSPQDVWGKCFQGIALDNCTIFATQIQTFMNTCKAGAQTTDAITWTTAHEIGHAFGCTTIYNADFGGNHVSAQANTILSQSVSCNCKKGTCTIPQTFVNSSCPLRLQLQ